MATYTRGEFLGMSAALVGAAGLGLRPGSEAEAAQADAGSGATADLALVNGRVYTMDEAQPRAEAFAVRNGTIVAVGSTADIRNLVTSRTDVIDAGGMTVTPGFIDAHCHPATGGLREFGQREPGSSQHPGDRRRDSRQGLDRSVARPLDRRLQVRRHEGGRRTADQPVRP